MYSGITIKKYLIPFLKSQINSKCIRIDGVWDRYHEDSLKAQTRVKRCECHGQRKRVATNIPIPKGADWQNVLKVASNKDDLFQFLSEQLLEETVEKHTHLSPQKKHLCSATPN